MLDVNLWEEAPSSQDLFYVAQRLRDATPELLEETAATTELPGSWPEQAPLFSLFLSMLCEKSPMIAVDRLVEWIPFLPVRFFYNVVDGMVGRTVVREALWMRLHDKESTSLQESILLAQLFVNAHHQDAGLIMSIEKDFLDYLRATFQEVLTSGFEDEPILLGNLLAQYLQLPPQAIFRVHGADPVLRAASLVVMSHVDLHTLQAVLHYYEAGDVLLWLAFCARRDNPYF